MAQVSTCTYTKNKYSLDLLGLLELLALGREGLLKDMNRDPGRHISPVAVPKGFFGGQGVRVCFPDMKGQGQLDPCTWEVKVRWKGEALQIRPRKCRYEAGWKAWSRRKASTQQSHRERVLDSEPQRAPMNPRGALAIQRLWEALQKGALVQSLCRRRRYRPVKIYPGTPHSQHWLCR